MPFPIFLFPLNLNPLNQPNSTEMNKSRLKYLFLITIIVNCFSSVGQPTKVRTDWNDFPAWENTTQYSKTYIVNQHHPEASDENQGTENMPLRTISKATELVKAGERILIHGGVYREMVILKNEGTSPNKMISIEAFPGEEVIIKGSRILKNEWIQRRVLTDVLPDSTLTYTWSRAIWLITLPDAIFENNYFPFKVANILPEEFALMPWARLVKKLAPYHSKRGLIFQNGKRMVQLENYGDLARVPGSFWIDTDGKTIHIHTFGGGNPNNELFEIGVQSHLFKPSGVGFGYVHLAGITFEHCANGFLRTSTGAVTILGGHHWIIENNKIRQNNSSGLEFGYYAFEFEDKNPQNIQPRTDEDLGGVIVRNNQISDCGTAGIRSYSVSNGIVENNHIWNCGWQDAENYWEIAGIKLLRTRNTLVRGNHIHDIQGGNGIWLDWDNQYSRVTGNYIHDIQTVQGGILIEASQFPNLVDHNIIWNIDGHGIYGNDTDELMIAHNLIANTTGSLVNAEVATVRNLGGRQLTCERNQIKNNIFIDGGKEIHLGSANNEVDYNLYVTSHEPKLINLSKYQASGFDKNSREVNAFTGFKDAISFFWESQEDIIKVPALLSLPGLYRTVDPIVFPGPFQKMNKNFRILLKEKMVE
jgi:alpha-N-arabinofuranosidase